MGMTNYEEAILKILKLLESETRPHHPNNDFLKFISNCEVPLLTQDQINLFIDTFHDTGDLLASLVVFHGNLVFDPAKLKQFLSFSNPNHNDLIHAAPFVYMNGLAFSITSNIHSFSEYFTIILRSVFSLTFCDYENAFFLYFFIIHNCIELASHLIRKENISLILSNCLSHPAPSLKAFNTIVELFIKVKASKEIKDQFFPALEKVIRSMVTNSIEYDDKILCDYIENLLNAVNVPNSFSDNSQDDKNDKNQTKSDFSDDENENSLEKDEIIENNESVKENSNEKNTVLDDLTDSEKLEQNNSKINEIFDLIYVLMYGNESENLRKIYSKLPKLINSFIRDKIISIEVNENDRLQKYEFEESSSDIQCDGVLNSKYWPDIIENPDVFKEIFRDEDVSFLSQITHILPINLHLIYIEEFMNSFERELSQNLDNFNLYLSFIFILQNLDPRFNRTSLLNLNKKKYLNDEAIKLTIYKKHSLKYKSLSDELNELLFNKIVFDPTLTIFNTSAATIFSLRSIIFNISFRSSSKAATNIFIKCEKWPLLYTELLLRTFDRNIFILFNDDFISSLYKVYFCLCHHYPNENEIKYSTRSIFYTFMRSLLNIPSIDYTEIKTSVAADKFLKIIFENSFQTTLFFDLKRLLLSDKCTKINQACNTIGNILKISTISSKVTTVNDSTNNSVSSSSHMISKISMIDDLLKIFYESMQRNTALSTLPINIFDSFLIFIEKLPNENSLIKFIKILSLYDNPVDNIIYQRMSYIIPKINPNELNDSLISSLFQLISLSSSDSKANFIIEHSQPIILIVSIFSFYHRIIEILQIINQLCDYSTCNRLRLHIAELDNILLDIFINYPNDITYKGCKISYISNPQNTKEVENQLLDTAFDIFVKIASTKSNHIVAERVMKVICHSKLSERFVKAFIPIDSLMKKYMNVKYPLGIKQLYFEADNISIRDIKRGISVAFWLFVDNPISQKLRIKSTVLKASKLFKIEVQEDSLFLSNIEGKNLIKAPIQRQHWNAIILNLHDSILSICINKKYNKEITMNELSRLKYSNENISFTFGNYESYKFNIDELLTIYNLSEFAIYNHELDEEEINQFIDHNLNGNPLYHFPNDPNNPPQHSATMFIDNNGSFQQLPNIVDILRFKYPIESITPLFLNFQKNEHRILLLNSIEDIFGRKFSTISEITSYLLSKNDSFIFTYELYLNFYKLLHNSPDREILFDSLLINCNLWVRAKKDDLIQIVNHWSTTLFNEHENLFCRRQFFIRFICEIRSCFYISSKTIKIPDRDPSLDFKGDSNRKSTSENNAYLNEDLNEIIRSCLVILVSISNQGINESEILIFIESLIKSDDYELTTQLIGILPSLLINVNASKDLIGLLLCLDFEVYSKSIHNLIQSLYLVSGSKFIDFYFASIALCYQIPPTLQYESFESDLFSFPALFTISLMTALRSSTETQRELAISLHQLSKDDKICDLFIQSPMWFIWPVLFSLQTNEIEIMSIFMGTIISHNFDKSNIDVIFSFLDLLNVQTSFNVTELKCSLAKGLFEMLKDDQKELYKVELLEIGFEALFIKCTYDNLSNQLMKVFHESVFGQEYSIPVEGESRVLSFTDLKLTLAIDLIQLSHMFCFTDRCHFSKGVNSFYQIYFSHVEKIKNTDFPHMLFRYFSQYPKFPQHKKAKILVALCQFESKLSSFFTDLCQRTMLFANELNEFFKIQESPLQEIDSMKQHLVDPIEEFHKEREMRISFVKQNWRIIVKHFVSPRAVYNMDCFEWKREFFMTPNFMSNKLKRSITIPRVNIKINTSPSLSIASYKGLLIKIDQRYPITFNIHHTKFDIISSHKFKSIKLNDIRHILTRNRYHKKTALEFFLMNGHSILIDFSPIKSSTILNKLSNFDIPNIKLLENDDFAKFVDRSCIVEQWLVRSITTFDFMMKLNMVIGRSFHDSENYIIFPWVVTGGNKPRDFNRPMAAQTDSKIAYYRRNLIMNKDNPDNYFVFGSAPSNAMLLSYYFVRMQPFTKLHLQIHDGKYDLAERMFKSVDAFFNGMNSSDDSRESVPEFYSMPEMFLDLSKNHQIGDLTCSNSEQSIFDAIYHYRKILESDNVSKNLNYWLDLMFGASQRGKEAVDKCNLYNPYLYEDIWNEKNKNEGDELMILTLLKNLGSMPPVVFSSKVQVRLSVPDSLTYHSILKIDFNDLIFKGYAYAAGDQKYNIIAIDLHGNVVKFNIDSAKEQSTMLGSYFLDASSNIKTIFHSKVMYIIDSNNCKVSSISSDQIRTKECQKFESIDFVISGNDTIFYTVNSTGSVKEWETQKLDRPNSIFKVYSDSIKSATVSKNFGVFVCGTNDGYCEVYSLNKQRFVNSFYLDGFVSQNLLVTPNLGLILIKTLEEIWVTTINGFLIKRSKMNKHFVEWIAWTNKHGIDWIAAADVNGMVWTFEAYYPENAIIAESCNESIVGISYEDNAQALLVVTQKPTFHIVPV
ncbi:hypothetical protein TRFO_04502 [Tritrichomonas foetus]|uniref:BEACH domain-containing protein n=1 Tax=Tritrichomonas foetus TaxID=1144522 RepID=A0A1J4KET2_9EUKA|nr:hypothetical protein TRFO_04502 [Tritrichomonas foetus]|eukprot:OHT09448.1 hypothetical protein TRFO_04502 [Tritrichomonas foetus]